MSDDAIAGEAAPADPPPQALAPVQPVQRPDPTTLLLFLGSGAVSLVYEVVWLRRLGLLLGGTSVAAAITLGAFMGGLAIGGWLGPRIAPPGTSLRAALHRYAALEIGAAILALGFPFALDLVEVTTRAQPVLRMTLAAALLLPPTTLLGATWPVLAPRLGARGATGLYAANTSGAVLGVLLATFALLPALGVRTTEVTAAVLGCAVAVAALAIAPKPTGLPTPEAVERPRSGVAPVEVLFAGFAAGLAALGLEVVWTRLAAVGLGGSVQTIGVVLATFLAAVAAGAWIGRTWPRDPRLGLGWGLGALAALALLGAWTWGLLPYGVAIAYAGFGADGLLPASALLAAIAMGGAPAASGIAFSCAVRLLEGRLGHAAGGLYAANTAGSILGSVAGGLWALPVLEVRGAVWLFAGIAALAGSVVLRRPWPALAAVALAILVPQWDARLYAVGVHLRISDFADPSLSAVRRFADEGWTLQLYDHGATGAVAVGRSDRTGNVWLSVNGKVDASTGDDMPTQVLSGELPVSASAHPANVLVVGLASGVTAGAVLDDPRVAHLDIIELEPAIVAASHHFDHVNGRPLDDPRTSLRIDDARAWLLRDGPVYDVIISEPSNPWISGVSNLFTREYWQAAKGRLADDGVFCQWVQLYGLPPDALRALVRTFSDVFGDVWLFETIEGSDVLLVAAPSLPDGLPLTPRLDPDGVRRLGGEGWLNTDDHPQVEWLAPRALHRSTAEANSRAIVEAGEE